MNPLKKYGAIGENRTPTSFRTTDFKSVASTYSATMANIINYSDFILINIMKNVKEFFLNFIHSNDIRELFQYHHNH